MRSCAFFLVISLSLPLVELEVLKVFRHQPVNENLQSHVYGDFVKRVHVIYMNHLDVGYDGLYPKEIGFINNVLNKYFVEYFPRAIQIAEDLRSGGHNETFIYTTHPWLVSLYMDCPPNLVLFGIKLQCPNATAIARFTKAVHRGYITWHAGPMNMQAENAPLWLFNYGLDISADLDKKFGKVRRYRTVSQRDVPGLTHAAVPSLVKKGIAAISVGVNDMSAPPAVPQPVFRWQYGAAEVLATWHPGGYPDNPGPSPKQPQGLSRKDCVVIRDFPDAMCFAFRTDNSGPPLNVKEISGYYNILKAEFPNADIKASNLENFMATLEPIRAKLPVVTKEIGDTWIQGTASDPRKQAEYRAIARVLGRCFEMAQCSLSDPRIYNASRFLLKMFEHTWGLSTEWDFIHWKNVDFHRLRSNKNFTDCEGSWKEQRAFSSLAQEALSNHSVRAEVVQELKKLKAQKPDLRGYEKIDIKMGSPVFVCKNFDMQFGSDGALTMLTDHKTGTQWADLSSPLGQFRYVTYNETDFVTFNSQYAYNISRNVGIMKINCSKNANPKSRQWPVDLVQLFKKNGSTICEFYAKLQMRDQITNTYYGAPKELWLHYSEKVPLGLYIDIQWFDKTVTRLAEAMMFSFTPRPQVVHQWRLRKLGLLIDPVNVIVNGSSLQHVIDDAVIYSTPKFDFGLVISSLDAPLVAPSTGGKMATPFPAPLSPLKNIDSMSFILHNNIWGTNYIFWYPYLDEDKDFKARFSVDFLKK